MKSENFFEEDLTNVTTTSSLIIQLSESNEVAKPSIIQEISFIKGIINILFLSYSNLEFDELKLLHDHCCIIKLSPFFICYFLLDDKPINIFPHKFGLHNLQKTPPPHFECVLTSFSSYNHGFYLRNSSFEEKHSFDVFCIEFNNEMDNHYTKQEFKIIKPIKGKLSFR